MKKKVEKEWLVEIHQAYCSNLFHGDSEVLVARIEVSAETAQEASDLGWEFIKVSKLENASVGSIRLVGIRTIAFNEGSEEKEEKDE